MFSVFLSGRPGVPIVAKSVLADALTQPEIRQARAGFAFVTRGGVAGLFEGLEATPGWENLPKRFIIGVSNGITEPAALRQLSALQ